MAAKTAAEVKNCYRAILAQVNLLDSLYRPKEIVKDLYEDLTELAYYIMENDDECIQKGIDQLQGTIMEMDCMVGENGLDQDIAAIISELRTHLDYILIKHQ